MEVILAFGVGSTYSGTAGSWAGTNYVSATGATSVVGTNGATFYITGVQLEKGSTATSFDFRPFGTELALCQRYFCTSFQNGATPASPNNLAVALTGLYTVFATDGGGASSNEFPQIMRSSPTIVIFSPLFAPAAGHIRRANGDVIAGSATFSGEKSFTVTGAGAVSGAAYQYGYTANAEL
jgi:hypothetical protein